MNIIGKETIRSPAEKNEECALFVIDNVGTPFVFHDITQDGQKYTIAFYTRSLSSGRISVGGESMETGSEWTRYVVTFIASGKDVPLYFNVPGTYYLYHTKLELGAKATDWTPAPEDTEAEITNLTEITTTHATNISVMQGQISSLIAEDTTIKGDYNALVSRYNATVETVDSIKTTIGEHTTLLDSQGKDVLAVTSKANTIESDLAGTKQTVSAIQSDLSGTKSRVTTVETGLDGVKTRVAATETALTKKADGTTVDSLTSRVATAETTLDGFEASLETTNKKVSDNEENLSKQSARIAETENAISLKVSTSDFNSYKSLMTESLSITDQEISLLKGQIALKVEQTDIDTAVKTIDDKLADYSTTTHMTAAINAAKDSITQSVSQSYATKTEINTVSGKVISLENWKTEASQKITKDGIIQTVGNYYAYQTDLNEAENRLSSVEAKATQTSEKFNWLVKSGTSATDFTLTDRTATLIAQTISLNGNVKVNGNMLVDGAVTANKIATDAIKSRNYAYSSGNFSTAGTFLDLSNGVIRSKNFGIDASGNAYFKGDVAATSFSLNGAVIEVKDRRTEWSVEGAQVYETALVFSAQDDYAVCIDGVLKGTNATFIRVDATSGLYENGTPLSNKYAAKSHTQDWSTITGKPSGSVLVPGIKSANAVGALNWTTNADYVPNLSLLAYWNGAYAETSSNLSYCNRGAFGTIVTKNVGDYLLSSGGTLSGALNVNNINMTGASRTWHSSVATSSGPPISVICQTEAALVPLARIRTKQGAWGIGAYDNNNSFYIYYLGNNKLATNTNGTDTAYQFGANGTLTVKALTQTSDENKKDIISGITAPYEAVFMELSPILHRWKDGDAGIHMGLGAQSVYASAKRHGLDEISMAMIHRGTSAEDPSGLGYTELIPLTIHMTQKNTHAITSIREEVTALAARQTALESTVEQRLADVTRQFQEALRWIARQDMELNNLRAQLQAQA